MASTTVSTSCSLENQLEGKAGNGQVAELSLLRQVVADAKFVIGQLVANAI